MNETAGHEKCHAGRPERGGAAMKKGGTKGHATTHAAGLKARHVTARAGGPGWPSTQPFQAL